MKTLLATAAVMALAASMPAAAQQRPLSDPVVAAPNPEALFTSKDAKLNRNKQARRSCERADGTANRDRRIRRGSAAFPRYSGRRRAWRLQQPAEQQFGEV